MGAFATEVIVFIARITAEGKRQWLPTRLCPACQLIGLIGHGWRWRQAHDASHSRIRIQRGICKRCDATVTFLPEWLVPGGHYSLHARQQAERLATQQACSVEECIPDSADPERSADPSTVRRWFHRRLMGLWWKIFWRFSPLPTLFAWDWKAGRRTLIPEPNST
jgi:hypothetical protein